MNYKISICLGCLVFIITGSLLAQPVEDIRRAIEKQVVKQEQAAAQNIQQMRKISPTLARFEEELLTISKNMQKITANYAKGKITKNSAAQRLRPLIKRSIEIRENTEYLTEKQLYNFLKSTR